MKASVLMAAAAAMAGGVVLMGGGQQPTPGPFTAEQATAGRTAYQGTCAVCHGADLTGAGAPELTRTFAGGWSAQT